MQRARILVVDDTRLVRMFVRQAFAGRPEVTIHEAEDGGKAQALLLESEFDLVLCDWDMPLLSGHELLTWIRAHERTDIRQLPFIMVTGNSEKERVLQAARAGVSGYIVKPFSAQQVVRQVENALVKHPGGVRPDAKAQEHTLGAWLQFDGSAVSLTLSELTHERASGLIPARGTVPAVLTRVALDLRLADQHLALPACVRCIEAADESDQPDVLRIALRVAPLTADQRRSLERLAAAFVPA
jgi:CheY-like chemotaxis protein